MTSRILMALAGHRPGRTAALTDASLRRDREERERLLSEDDVFRAAMAERGKHAHVVLGDDRSDTPYIMPVTDITGSHGWVSAATGAGKSRFVGSIIAQLLEAVAAGAAISVVVYDLKGELADLTLRAAGAVAARLPCGQRDRFLRCVRTIRPFAGNYLVPLQLLRHDPSVSVMTQAHAIAETLEMASAAALGVRQARSLTFLLALGIEAGLSLPELRLRLFYDRAQVDELARRSQIPEVRLYFSRSFGGEEATSLEGVAARLDAVLRVDALKAALAADTMFDFRACCTPGLTVVDFGDPPFGAEGAACTVAGLLLPRLAWSAFAPGRPRGTRVVLIADEIQMALAGTTNAHHLSRILTTGRSAGISLYSVHQGVAQLPKEFTADLGQNVRFRVIGRSSEADAEAASEWLPVTGGMPRSRAAWEPPDTSHRTASRAEELRERVAAVGRLPQRAFLVADRLAGFRPRLVTAASWNPPAWAELPRDVAEAVQHGSAGLPRREALESARTREAAWVAALEGQGGSASPGRRQGGRNGHLVLPDLVGAVGTRAGRRPGGVV